MLVVYNNIDFLQWSLGDPVRALDYRGEVVVVFDPSKTNMAMLVGTPDKQILEIVEFSGNNRRRGPAMDTTLYCEEVREFLRAYLSNVKLYKVAVEQALTYKGIEYHKSNMVLTEIRSNILNYFFEMYRIKVLEINNWAWKFGVLPDGYRSKFEKGSKKWFLDVCPDSPWTQFFEADATDVICIYWYVVDEHCKSYSLFCIQAEPCTMKYSWSILPTSFPLTSVQEVLFNKVFTIEQNLDYYMNRCTGVISMNVPADLLEYSDIYKRASQFTFDMLEDSIVKVVACRQC